jgi:hypothetical protein
MTHADLRCNGGWTLRANRYWRFVTKQTRTTREGPSAPGGLSGRRVLRRLLLWGSSASFGALDTLLFGGATAPDVRLHRLYNRTGAADLQWPAAPGSIRRLIAIVISLQSN